MCYDKQARKWGPGLTGGESVEKWWEGGRGGYPTWINIGQCFPVSYRLNLLTASVYQRTCSVAVANILVYCVCNTWVCGYCWPSPLTVTTVYKYRQFVYQSNVVSYIYASIDEYMPWKTAYTILVHIGLIRFTRVSIWHRPGSQGGGQREKYFPSFI